jgi:membrane-associated phospholipid phosphatase
VLAGFAWQRRRTALAASLVPIVVTFVSGVQGVHWPTDAVGGTLLGALAAAVVLELLSQPRAPARPQRRA